MLGIGKNQTDGFLSLLFPIGVYLIIMHYIVLHILKYPCSLYTYYDVRTITTMGVQIITLNNMMSYTDDDDDV